MSFLPILICYYVLSFNIYHHFFDEKWSVWGLRHSLFREDSKPFRVKNFFSDEQTIFKFLEFLAGVEGVENCSGMKRSEMGDRLSLGRSNPVGKYLFARGFH